MGRKVFDALAGGAIADGHGVVVQAFYLLANFFAEIGLDGRTARHAAEFLRIFEVVAESEFLEGLNDGSPLAFDPSGQFIVLFSDNTRIVPEVLVEDETHFGRHEIFVKFVVDAPDLIEFAHRLEERIDSPVVELLSGHRG